MILSQIMKFTPEQTVKGESYLPAITAISQEILNQPYRVPRKLSRKKRPVTLSDLAMVTVLK
jgi:hypothetical protein